MKHDDTNPFKLEDLVIPETAVDAKAKASLLGGTSSVVAVFLALMFKGFNARCPTFALRPDAFKDIGIDRHAQLYALRDLAKRGLITVERRHGPKKPPTVTIIGMRKTKG